MRTPFTNAEGEGERDMKDLTRRAFLADSGKSVAAAVLAASGVTVIGGRATGANERVNVAMIGCGGRGNYVARGMLECGANLTCLCDLNPERLKKSWAFLSQVQQSEPRFVNDMRTVFDARDVDAVIVATPDHWHAPASILAVQADKDVYVEKPHAHCIWESGRMVEAAEKYKRIVQVGTQNRSGPYNRQALEYVRSGKLGRICLVKVYNMKPGGPFKLGDPGTCPEGFDWDRWLGRSPVRPYHQSIFNHGWHHFWDFSGGDMADDGIHQIDLALMLMGDPGYPRSVRSVGGRFCHRGDDSQQPDVQIVNWAFDDFVMTFELTEYPRYMRKTDNSIRRNDALPYWTHNATRIELYGSELMMTIGRHGGGWIVQQPGGKAIETVYGRPCDEPHYRNFLDCVKSRAKPSADVATAHTSNVIMHMGNIAHRVGNLALNWDAQACRFNNEEANKLIKDEYRKGYEIPADA